VRGGCCSASFLSMVGAAACGARARCTRARDGEHGKGERRATLDAIVDLARVVRRDVSLLRWGTYTALMMERYLELTSYSRAVLDYVYILSSLLRHISVLLSVEIKKSIC
jgi:hypothetical protein